MRLSMTLTLDGMIRALRMRGHDLAERIETGAGAFDTSGVPGPRRSGRPKASNEGESDDERRD